MELIKFVNKATAFAKANGKDKAVKEFNNNKSAEFINGDLYIFAHDFNGNSLAHPYRPDLVGRSLLDMKDSNGVAFEKNMLSVAKSGNGFVYYIFPNPARNNKQELKLTYVEKVDDTWWLGSGIYLSSISANFSQQSRHLLIEFVEAAVKYAKDRGKDNALKLFNNKDGMFFTRDLYVFADDFEGNQLALPIQPDLVGKNRIDVVDPNGVKIVRDLINLARAGSGFVYYFYPDPSKNMVWRLKLSYIMKVDDTWWLGAGLYASDLNEPD